MRAMVDGWNRSPRAGPVAFRVEGGDDDPEGEPVRQQATDTLDHRAGRDRVLAYPSTGCRKAPPKR